MSLSWWSGLTSLGHSLHGEFALQALAVASDSGYGERLSAAPSDQDSLAVAVALHHAAAGELGDGDALRKVGPAQFLFFCHWLAVLLF